MDKHRIGARIKSWFTGFDKPLALIVFLLFGVGLIALYSASIGMPGRLEDQLRNILLSFVVMWAIASVPTQTLMRVAVPLYTVGIALLIAVAMFGLIRKGARRWLNVGIVVQPSEILKIAVPLTLAWYFQMREGAVRWFDYIVAALLLAVPVGLIARQPDLGTALLVLAAGLYIIYFAGLSWRLIAPVVGTVAVAAILLITFQTQLCAPGTNWPILHDYQQHRVCTLLDPTSDPLGKGFHTIQSIIAIGSGGTTGKGWLKGTQTHLEFIPEKHTDFIFAVFSEEFGLIGNVVLLLLYTLLVLRGFYIAAHAPSLFSRLLAGSITMIFFTYAFVNMGMVSGILPVVGVPLPLFSYGGTALVTLGMGIGILMNISRHKRFVQS